MVETRWDLVVDALMRALVIQHVAKVIEAAAKFVAPQVQLESLRNPAKAIVLIKHALTLSPNPTYLTVLALAYFSGCRWF